MDAPSTGGIDHAAILATLPHRYPFLLIDCVTEFHDRRRLVAIKNVTINEPYFQGHFPGRPIMPGVLICEALGQAGLLLAYRSTDGIPAGRQIVLAGLDHVRFRRPVHPGDQLRLEVWLLRRRSPVLKMRGEASVGGQLATEAEFTAVEIAPESQR